MPSAQPNNALVVADSTNLKCVIPFNRQYWELEDQMVADGGKVISRAKSPMKVTTEQYTSFMNSTSDQKWNSYLLPTNILLLEMNEGKYPYAFFDVDGHENAKLICNPIPMEVAQKIFPKLLAEVQKDPEQFGLKLTGVDESKAKKNQGRIDALKWVPTDCQSDNNKSKTMKPCRPNPQSNDMSPTPIAVKKMHDEMMKAFAPKTTGSKRKLAEKESADANAIPDGVTFQVKRLLPGVEWDMVAPLCGGIPKFEVIGDRCYLRLHKRTKPALETEEDPAAEEGGEEGDDA